MKGGDRWSKPFCKTFKQMAKCTELASVIDEEGAIHTEWDSIAIVVVDHLIKKLLGETQLHFPQALAQVLNAQIRSITEVEKQIMEEPLTSAELLKVVKSMAKGKALGPQGIPVELYIQNWETVGETVLTSQNH